MSLIEEEHRKNFKNISIDRVSIAKYAGASGDFNPIHVDEEFAKNSPLKGVIAHGMLSMGFIAQYVESLLSSPESLKNIKVQFRQIVRPTDIVSCYAKEMDEQANDFGEIKLNIQVRNQKEEVVVKGSAIVKK